MLILLGVAVVVAGFSSLLVRGEGGEQAPQAGGPDLPTTR